MPTPILNGKRYDPQITDIPNKEHLTWVDHLQGMAHSMAIDPESHHAPLRDFLTERAKQRKAEYDEEQKRKDQSGG